VEEFEGQTITIEDCLQTQSVAGISMSSSPSSSSGTYMDISCDEVTSPEQLFLQLPLIPHGKSTIIQGSVEWLPVPAETRYTRVMVVADDDDDDDDDDDESASDPE
jgi:hypothetical protein